MCVRWRCMRRRLLSKSIVITLPVALLIWHWWQRGRGTSTDLLRLVPFCV